MKKIHITILALIGMMTGLAVVPAAAVTITDATLHNGSSPQAIDPKNRIKLWPTNGRMTRAQLYQSEGFGVVQDFVGFVNGTNYLAFTNPNRADLRIGFSEKASIGTVGGIDNSGSALGNAAWTTSGESAIRFISSTSNTGVHNIAANLDFGKFADGNFQTTSFPVVSAVGFTLTSQMDRFVGINSITVTYLYTDEGVSPFVQKVSDFSWEGGGNIGALFFSHGAPTGLSISGILIDVSVKAAADRDKQQIIIGIDDIGYTTAIPEPAHVALAFVAGALALAIWHRRR